MTCMAGLPEGHPLSVRVSLTIRLPTAAAAALARPLAWFEVDSPGMTLTRIPSESYYFAVDSFKFRCDY